MTLSWWKLDIIISLLNLHIVDDGEGVDDLWSEFIGDIRLASRMTLKSLKYMNDMC